MEINPHCIHIGDPILVQGTSIISRIIRWATNCHYSHAGIIFCRLRKGDYMVMEMLAAGMMIRPLFVYKGMRVDSLKMIDNNDIKRAEDGILTMMDKLPRTGYNFKGFLYLSLILIPKRIFQRSTQTKSIPPEIVLRMKKPNSPYQWFCYCLVEVIAAITLMNQWSNVVRLFSKNVWLEFTERIATAYALVKNLKGTATYTELVRIVEDIYEDYREYVE